METHDELVFDDENVCREGKDDIKKVVRRLKKSAKRPRYESVRDQERTGLDCPELKAARYRLC